MTIKSYFLAFLANIINIILRRHWLQTKITAKKWPLKNLLALFWYKNLFKFLLRLNFMSIYWLVLKWECVEVKILKGKNANQLFQSNKNWKSLFLKIQRSSLQEMWIFMQDYQYHSSFWDFFIFWSVILNFHFSI